MLIKNAADFTWFLLIKLCTYMRHKQRIIINYTIVNQNYILLSFFPPLRMLINLLTDVTYAGKLLYIGTRYFVY